MDTNAELLNYIRQNAQMGQNTIHQLAGIAQDGEFKALLDSQFNEYKKMFDTTEKRLKTMGMEVKDINALSKMSAYFMINMETLTDNSAEHIAEMMIQGSTMGVIQITRKLKEYKTADEEVKYMGEHLLNLEQKNIEECKRYLVKC
ncbi:MAG: hypothetical protein WCP73_06695 [Eubacteriales bacterium]